ncbi:MAG: DUF2085 domain-containing protein [Acidobacteriota bacterium]|nr:DUF2085 domain-containing protein [Acidobacteriota bacterium]
MSFFNSSNPQSAIRNPQCYVPQVVGRESLSQRAILVWGVAAACALAFVSLVFAAPWALERGHQLTAAVLYGVFGQICHQIPARSFYWHEHPLAVCARCVGVYAGCAVGVLCYPLMRSLKRTDAPPRRWLVLVAAPAVIDFSLTFFGLWENTHTSRLLTGALLGAGAVFFVMPGLVDLVQTRGLRRFSHSSASKPATSSLTNT